MWKREFFVEIYLFFLKEFIALAITTEGSNQIKIKSLEQRSDGRN